MTNQDRQEFATLLLGLGETYGEPVSDPRMEVYFRALSDLDLGDIREAANLHVRTSKFFPKPAELREAIDGSADDRAEFAWTEMQRLVRAYGYYREPPADAWSDEAARRAAYDLYGGWKALCSNLPAQGPEMLGTAKLFKSSYCAYDGRVQRAALPPTTEEAKFSLAQARAELAKRGLPTHGL